MHASSTAGYNPNYFYTPSLTLEAKRLHSGLTHNKSALETHGRLETYSLSRDYGDRDSTHVVNLSSRQNLGYT